MLHWQRTVGNPYIFQITHTSMLPPYCALACALPSLAKGNRNGFLCLTRLYQRGMSKCVEAQTLISTQQIIWQV